MEFYNTKMGKTFYEGTLPSIKRALEKIGKGLEKKETIVVAEVYPANTISAVCKKEAEAGHSFVSCTYLHDGYVVLAFEKEKEKKHEGN